MLWVEVFALFVVSHLIGDFVLQTDWQATHKAGGLSRDRLAQRALFSHVATYTLAFVPALIWLCDQTDAATAIGIGFVIAIPHLIQDDRRLLTVYLRRVKGVRQDFPDLIFTAVDQSFHMAALLGAALLAAA